jgi:hypothetical protein
VLDVQPLLDAPATLVAVVDMARLVDTLPVP